MGKVDLNKQEKEARLLDTAFQLFTTKGMTKTSISDIVNNAGVAKGTFYLYFKDKYDIADKLVSTKTRALCQQAAQRMEQADIQNAEDRIIFIMDDLINELDKNRTLLYFINKNLSWGIFRNALTRAEEQNQLDSSDFFRRVFREDIVNWHDLTAMLYIIIEMAGSTCHSVILEQDPMPLEEFRPHLHQSVRAVMKNFKNKEQ